MKKFGLLGCGGLVALLLVVGVGLFMYFSALKTAGVRMEGDLTEQYSKDQNEYSSYATGLVEQLGVTDAQKDAIKEIVVAYVSGRKAPEGSGQLMTAVKEAVPDLSSLKTYEKIVDYIQKGREKFKAQQDAMIARIKTYENWQNEGLIKPMLIRIAGFPSNRLRATVGSQSYYGQSALEKMRVIVTSAETQKAFETGTDKPIVAPKGK